MGDKEIRAFLFDLDGVITDTAAYHFQAWKELADSIGITIDGTFNEQLKGLSRMDSLERILRHGGKQHAFSVQEKTELAAVKNSRYIERIQQLTPADILPGIKPLLNRLKAEGVKIGLASASKNARTILERLELQSYFDGIADAAVVMHGKPHPEIFWKAADILDVPYACCVGIEDAAAGVQAVKSAGMFAVGVGNRQIMHQADLVVEDTSQLDFQKIAHFFVTGSKTF